ncbi:hypothetical protein GOV12_06175 [Candidatus Pacearchaeota archaeon]|nr:hypothetical protein [Candidatus Pacearchaeota archaeon]
MKGILCFGDSITFGMGCNGGWVGRLKKYFEFIGNHNGVYNLGINGNTTTDLLKRFEVEASSRIRVKRPADDYMIIIAIGINDSKSEGGFENLVTDSLLFEKNIKKLVNESKKFTKNVVFVGLTPVDEKLACPYENSYFTNDKIKEYNEVIRKVCVNDESVNGGVRFLDIYESLNELDFLKCLSDGLHPDSKGHDMMFEIIRNGLGDFLD